MCMDHKISCSCGRSSASFNFKDDVLPSEIIEKLYCPECSADVSFDPESMVEDNAWVIAYDMDMAKFMGNKLPVAEVTPNAIFDEGYCAWRGVYPTDHIDSVREREELVKLSKINTQKYFTEFRRWSIERMDRLSKEGWRKANEDKRV